MKKLIQCTKPFLLMMLISFTTLVHLQAQVATNSSQVKVSPNPSNGDFSIDFSDLNVAKSLVRVYDAQGKQVLSSANNANLKTISLGNMPNGLYLLEIETAKGRVLKRLIKTN